MSAANVILYYKVTTELSIARERDKKTLRNVTLIYSLRHNATTSTAIQTDQESG